MAMPDTEIDTYLSFMSVLGDAAAKVSLSYFRQPLSVDNKLEAGFDPVTAADQGAERAIRTLIEEHFPNHGIDGEEYGNKPATGSPYSWSLDPVDGTRAFIAGLPSWGTLIALLYEGEPVIGMIDQPYVRERYIGTPHGSTLNGDPIHTRAAGSIADSIVMTTDPALFSPANRPGFDRLADAAKLTRYGFDCYAYAVLAAGHVDIVIEEGLKPHDMLALIPVVRGAGGSATRWNGSPADGHDQILALGNPALLDDARRLLGH